MNFNMIVNDIYLKFVIYNIIKLGFKFLKKPQTNSIRLLINFLEYNRLRGDKSEESTKSDYASNHANWM